MFPDVGEVPKPDITLCPITSLADAVVVAVELFLLFCCFRRIRAYSSGPASLDTNCSGWHASSGKMHLEFVCRRFTCALGSVVALRRRDGVVMVGAVSMNRQN